jgi:hypothetical protein
VPSSIIPPKYPRIPPNTPKRYAIKYQSDIRKRYCCIIVIVLVVIVVLLAAVGAFGKP